MKIDCLILIASLALFSPAKAQDTSNLIALGRTFLAQQNITNANANLRAAVVSGPNDEVANALYAWTRVFAFPFDPEISGFLDRVGISKTNRNVYDWKTTVLRDTNGIPFAPQGMSAAEASEIARRRLLPEIEGAASNLAKVVSTTFVLNLSSNETTIGAITLDYGDVRLIESLLHFGAYLGYTVSQWNFDAQLSALRSLYTNNSLSSERLLSNYPELFTFATTNDLGRAQEAFRKAANSYKIASNFIRARSTNIVRLFNYDPEMDEPEARFRTTLMEIVQSLDGPVVLTENTNVLANLGKQFENPVPLRDFLPEFSTNRVVAGTLPDESFGGVVRGVAKYQIESVLGKERSIGKVQFVSQLEILRRLADGSLQIRVNALDGAFCVVQASTDLRSWTDAGSGTARQGVLLLTNPPPNIAARYYRAIDRSDAVRFDGMAIDVVTEKPVSGAAVTLQFPDTGAVGAVSITGQDGNFSIYAQPGREFGQVKLSVLSSGHSLFEYNDFFHERRRYFFLPVYLASPSYRPVNDLFVNRTLITTGTNAPVTGYTVGATSESGERILSARKTVWWSWIAPESGALVIDASESLPSAVIGVYVGDSLSTLRRIWISYQEGGFFVSGGVRYEIQADAANLAGKAVMKMKWITPEGPRIDSHPRSQNRLANNYVSFSIAATGTQPLAYQWQKNGNPIANATNTYFEITRVGADDAGEYSTVISNLLGSVVSSNATLTVTSGPGPVNDHFQNATVLIGTNVTIAGTNVGATKESNEPDHYDVPGGKSIWWKWTAQGVGSTTVDAVGTSFDTVMAVYAGSSLQTLQEIASNDDAPDRSGRTSKLSFQAQPNTTYFIAIDGYAQSGGGAQSGTVQLRLTQVVITPANDHFRNASTIVGNDGLFTISNVGATKEAGEPNHAGNTGGGSIWWRWTPGATGLAAVDTSGSAIDTVMAVYTGNSISTLEQVVSDDDGGDGSASRASFQAQSGRTYYIAVDSHATGTTVPRGSIRLQLSLTQAPDNDSLQNARVIFGTDFLATGSNVRATKEGGELNHAGNPGGASIWWRWTPQANGPVTLDTSGSTFNTLLAVYTGSSINTLQSVTSNDDNGGALQSRVSFEAKSGITYYIVVDGYFAGGTASAGDVRLRLIQSVAPVDPANSLAGKTLQLMYSGGGGERFDFTTDTLARYEQGTDPFAYTWDSVNSRITGVLRNSQGDTRATYDIRLTFIQGSATQGTAIVVYQDQGGSPISDPATFTLVQSVAPVESARSLAGKTLQLSYGSQGERFDFTSDTNAIYEQGTQNLTYSWDPINTRLLGTLRSANGQVVATYDIDLTFNQGSEMAGTATVIYSPPDGNPQTDPATFTLR